jgi:PTS system nitrogen regulatory IIA component
MARRIGVSSAYLSRVENGRDAVPSPERLSAIARELDVPPSLLMDVSRRMNPLVAQYLEDTPGASMLLLDIARRRLTGPQLARVREFLDAEFPVRGVPREEGVPALAPLLDVDRVVLQLSCGTLEDAVDVAAGRLAAAGVGAPRLAEGLMRREQEVSSAVGNGVVVPHGFVTGAPPLAALVTLAKPLKAETPDERPLRLVLVFVSGERGRPRLVRLAHVARLASRGLADRLLDAQRPQEVLERLSELETIR